MEKVEFFDQIDVYAKIGMIIIAFRRLSQVWDLSDISEKSDTDIVAYLYLNSLSNYLTTYFNYKMRQNPFENLQGVNKHTLV